MKHSNTATGESSEQQDDVHLGAAASSELYQAQARPNPVTRRAFCIGLILALAFGAVLPYNDYFVGATYLSGNWFPIGGVAALLVLTLVVNPILIRSNLARLVFSPAEIITIWAMIVVVSGIPSSGLMRYLIPHIAGPQYYATSANGWESTLVNRMPARLMVSDHAAARAFFEGLKRGAPIPWAAWVRPLFYWSQFVVLLYSIFFCLATIVRRQWMDNEKYSFPLVKLPAMMAETPEPGKTLNDFLRDPLLWTAIILVSLVHTVKGLHLFYPAIIDIPLAFQSTDWITTPPYNSVNNITIAIFPLVIGFSYLLSSDVCLSLWLFYIVFKLQVLFGAMHSADMSGAGAGISMGPGYVTYQEAGGAAMLAVWLLWSMRAHLAQVWRKAWRGDPSVDDSSEPMPYRLALLGFIAAYVGLFVWLTWVADIAPMMSFGLMIGSLVIMLMLSWLVAQAGLLFMQQSFSPAQITLALVGKFASFEPSVLASAVQVEHVGWFDAREMMMPSLLNSQKAAADTSLSSRSLMKALAICVALAVVVSAGASIWLPYTHGGGTALKNPWMYVAAPQLPFVWAAQHATSGGTVTPGSGLVPNALAGALVVGALFMARAAIPSFPLSPAGFLVAATYPMYMLWFSTFLGWAFKGPILRYGGMRGYRRMLPFFLGLILGDCINAIIWTVVGLVTHVGYSLLPG